MIEPQNELQQRRSVAFNKKRRVVLFEIANHIFSKTYDFKDYLVDIANWNGMILNFGLLYAILEKT